MICGFALLLWSIEKSMPVYAEESLYSGAYSAMICEGENGAMVDNAILSYDSGEGCFRWIFLEDPLKECEEELASLRAYVDSLNWVTIPEGWKVESVEGEWSEKEK